MTNKEQENQDSNTLGLNKTVLIISNENQIDKPCSNLQEGDPQKKKKRIYHQFNTFK